MNTSAPKSEGTAVVRLPEAHLRSLPPKSGPSAAFSLLELLAAMAVLSLLSVVLFQMVDGATRLWRDKEKRVESYREARAALGFISREIGSALVLPHATGTIAGTPVYTSTNGLPAFVLTSASNAIGANADFTPTDPAQALFFLAALPASARGATPDDGDICAVGYYLAYTADSSGIGATARSRKLYRHFRGSADTLNAVRAALRPVSVPGAFVTGGLFRPSASSDEPLARNIADFRVTAMTEKPDGSLQPAAGEWDRQIWPPAVEIRITALNSAAAARLSTESDWDNTNVPAVLSDSRIFTARVALPSRPPRPETVSSPLP